MGCMILNISFLTIPLFSIGSVLLFYLVSSMGVEHAVLPDVKPLTVAFTVLAQLCGPKANETEMGAII